MNFKKDFPFFSHHPKLTYLDSAATTQKPKSVIKRIEKFYEQENSNIRRGFYKIAEEATANFENARQTVANFIGAEGDEIIFTRNTTESINLIAQTWGRTNLNKGDFILLTEMEHHSNLLPWQEISRERGARLKWIKTDPKDGRLNLTNLNELINQKTKVLALSQASNVLGTVNDLPKIIRLFRQISQKGIVVGDLAQAVPHLPIKIKELDLDFAAFSSHKLYGPLGVGVLFGRRQILSSLPPFLVGGGNVESVSQKSSIYQITPWKFEAGTPDIAGVLGLEAAIAYLNAIGWQKIQSHEKSLTEYALNQLSQIKDLMIYGPKEIKDRIGVIAFNLEGIHAHDIAQVLAEEGIAVRSGHHCCQPLHQNVLKVPATCRASFGIYNDQEDIDHLIQGLKKAKKILAK